MCRFLLMSLLAVVLVSPLSAQSSGSQNPLEKVAAARNKMESAKAMRQLMIAMHNYHGDYNSLPAHAIYDQAGKKPLLSWRVAVLPYLEPHRVMDALYKRFKMDEPWDSPNNKALIKDMPKVFAMPGVKSEPGMTHYQVFTMPLTSLRPAGCPYYSAIPACQRQFPCLSPVQLLRAALITSLISLRCKCNYILTSFKKNPKNEDILTCKSDKRQSFLTSLERGAGGEGGIIKA